MALQPVPSNFLSGGSGISDGTLKRVIDQLRARKMLAYTAGGTIVAATKGSATLSDGTGTTLTVTARLGGEHANAGATTGIYRSSTRKTLSNGLPGFDFEVAAVDNAAAAAITFASADVNAGTDIVTKAHTFTNGAGPYYAFTDNTLPTGLANKPLFVIVLTSGTFSLAASKALALAGTAIDITGVGTGVAHTLNLMKYEGYLNASMKTSDQRYILTLVNSGGHGGTASEYVTLADSLNGNAENRPSDHAFTALTAGAGEATVTGVQRGDHIESVVNQTTGVLPSTTAVFDTTNKDRIVLTSGTFVTASTNIVLVSVLPKQ